MAAAAETMLLTIFLRHDQSNNLDTIQARLKAANWWGAFPPEGVEIVSWTVAMGFGQIVTGAFSAPSAIRLMISFRCASASRNACATEASNGGK